MTKPQQATDRGLEPHWKVRIVAGGGLLHIASRIQPEIVMHMGRLVNVVWEPIDDHRYGDTVGFLDWSTITGITWRYAE